MEQNFSTTLKNSSGTDLYFFFQSKLWDEVGHHLRLSAYCEKLVRESLPDRSKNATISFTDGYVRIQHTRSKTDIAFPIFLKDVDRYSYKEDDEETPLVILASKINDIDYLFNMWARCALMSQKYWERKNESGLKLGIITPCKVGHYNSYQEVDDILFEVNDIWRVANFNSQDPEECREASLSDYESWTDKDVCNNSRRTHAIFSVDDFPKLREMMRIGFLSRRYDRLSGFYHTNLTKAIERKNNINQKKLIAWGLVKFEMRNKIWIWKPCGNRHDGSYSYYECIVDGDSIFDKPNIFIKNEVEE